MIVMIIIIIILLIIWTYPKHVTEVRQKKKDFSLEAMCGGLDSELGLGRSYSCVSHAGDVGWVVMVESCCCVQVLRHLKDGDMMLLNRQPTLHRPSIQAHRVSDAAVHYIQTRVWA